MREDDLAFLDVYDKIQATSKKCLTPKSLKRIFTLNHFLFIIQNRGIEETGKKQRSEEQAKREEGFRRFMQYRGTLPADFERCKFAARRETLGAESKEGDRNVFKLYGKS